MMIYLINSHQHYFAISAEAWIHFDSDYLQQSGCTIFSTLESMYDHLNHAHGYALDEVEGNEIEITLNVKGELLEKEGRNMLSAIEAPDCNVWLATYYLE